MYRVRGFIILGRHKVTNEYVGYVENSFSMGFDKEYTNVYYNYVSDYDNKSKKHERATTFTRWLKDIVNNLNKRFPAYEWKFYRARSKSCPVKIHIDKGNGKWYRRNKKFTVK